MQKAQQLYKGHLMGAVICAWKAHAARQAQLSSLTADIVAKQRKRQSATTFAGWRQRASRKRANKAKVRLCLCYRPISTCCVYSMQKIAKLKAWTCYAELVQ